MKVTTRKLWDPTDCVEFTDCGKIRAYYSGDIIFLDCGPGECSDCKLEEEEE